MPWSTTTPNENSVLQQVVVTLATYLVFQGPGDRLQVWQHQWAWGWSPALLSNSSAQVGWEAGVAPRGEVVLQCEHRTILRPGARCWLTGNRPLLFFLPFHKFRLVYMTVIATSSLVTFLYKLQLTFYFLPCFGCREDWSCQDQGNAPEALFLYSFLLHFEELTWKAPERGYYLN